MAQATLTSTFSDIADAIRTKTGKVATMTPAEMPGEILSISGGGFDYKAWLQAAGISPSGFADLAAVLADEETVRHLMTIHAAVDYLTGFTASDASIQTILNNNYAAKWINLRDYALDTLDGVYGTLMSSIGKYGYGEWAYINNTWQPKGNVPIMTSDTAPYGEASADTTTSGGYPYAPFNGADKPNWRSRSTSGSWIQYKFTNPVCVKRLLCRVKPTGVFQAGKFKLQASNDGSTFVDLSTFDYLTDDNCQTEDIANNNYYLYYRIATVTANMTNGCTQWNTIQFYGRTLSVSVPTMTSNTAPYGVAIIDKQYSTFAPWYAFDGDDSTSHYSQTHSATIGTDGCGSIGYKFTTPVNVRLIHMKAYNSSYANKAFKVRYSDDGTNWTYIESEDYKTSLDGNFEVSNSGYHQYWFVTFFDGNFVSTEYFNTLKTLQFYGENYSEYDWDTDTPRRYLYDHGMELETITKVNQSGGNGTLTKESDQMIIGPASPNGYAIYAEAKISTTGLELSRAILGGRKDGTSFVALAANTNATFTGTNAYSSYNNGDSNMPYNLNLDISAFTQNNSVGIYVANSSVVASITEWWLE